MYCGQCGKKVMDNMLFCPFCGQPIVIPDQDDVPAAKPAPQPEAPEQPEIEIAEESKAPVSLFDVPQPEPTFEEPVAEEPEEEFVPLSFDLEDVPEEESVPQPEPEPEIIVDIPDEQPAAAPARRSAPQTKRPPSARKRPANTYIPVKDIAPDDIFMDGDEDDDYDLDDDFDDIGDDYYYEDQDEGSFFQRHIRGIVGLLLFLLLVAICAFWANTGKGQMTLARFNLAWRPEPYAELAYEAYQANNDLMAARYYEKAFSRSEESNYEYAHSAMVAYYEADEIEASAAMLKICVAMDPDNPEPYQELMILYPDAETRPWEIRELIRQGYERTGNESLKQ
ncbi:MAG: zinc ribbon domain-containing protein [Clostridia bacterium]|nr:zinc ribbon domain-containing protein [Clostridia bacterium]